MTLSQFFILSPRGDVIINKDFRGDSHPTLHDTFFRKVKFFGNGEAPPVFNLDGINFIFIRRNSLLIACTTRYNVSPSSILELLNRLAKVFKDYCGILTEESIRKNFTLIYELVDEMLDFGYPQITSTEMLKNFIHNEASPVETSQVSSSMLMTMNSRTKPSSASNIPIGLGMNKGGKNKNEIFVDIIERLAVLFNSSGYVINSSIDGSILMKSFLSGNPELRLALNEDLVLGKGSGTYGSVVIDDCNFHECVHLDEFESSKTIHFIPPDGEFSVFNYRITSDFPPPFRIFPTIEEPAPYKLEMSCTIRADFPESNSGSNVIIKIPVPRATTNVYCEFTNEIHGATHEFNSTEKNVIVNVKKFPGGSEIILKLKITLDQICNAAIKREIGPIAVGFEIPMFNVSKLQVKYLRIAETHKDYNPYRWVRYITQSSSYVCRL